MAIIRKTLKSTDTEFTKEFAYLFVYFYNFLEPFESEGKFKFEIEIELNWRIFKILQTNLKFDLI